MHFFMRAVGYRAVVASTPASTYGVEAPAARAHGSRFERYVGVWFNLYGLVPCLVPCSADSWRRPVWWRHDYKPTFLGKPRHSGWPTFSTFFLNLLLGVCIFLASVSFDHSASLPEVSANGSSQALSFDNYCPTSGGLRQNMSGHAPEFN